jgi:hypothetical protein
VANGKPKAATTATRSTASANATTVMAAFAVARV